MTGTIESFDSDKLYGKILSGSWYIFFHVRGLRLDNLGRQICNVRLGAPVEFSLLPGPNRAKQAIDVHYSEEEFAEPVDLESHRELSEITHWIPGQQIGYALRESGDWIGVSHRAVTTLGLETVKIGTCLWHGIKFVRGFDPNAPLMKQTDPKDVVRASPIEICLPTVEPSLEAPQILAPSESPLFSEKLRSVPLRRIGIRRKSVA